MKRRFENILIGLLVGVFSLVIIIVLFRFTALANVFIAWAILMLATAAFWSIHHSKEQERHHREAETLKEIMEWVDGVIKCCAVYSQNPGASDRNRALAAATELKIKSDYVTITAEGLGGALVLPLKRVTDLLAAIYDRLEEDAGREKLEGLCIEVKVAISLLRGK